VDIHQALIGDHELQIQVCGSSKASLTFPATTSHSRCEPALPASSCHNVNGRAPSCASGLDLCGLGLSDFRRSHRRMGFFGIFRTRLGQRRQYGGDCNRRKDGILSAASKAQGWRMTTSVMGRSLGSQSKMASGFRLPRWLGESQSLLGHLVLEAGRLGLTECHGTDGIAWRRNESMNSTLRDRTSVRTGFQRGAGCGWHRAKGSTQSLTRCIRK
jgi:hypothetical protein